MIKRSILIPWLVNRDVKPLLDVLRPQLTDEVEIIIMTDNKQRTLSDKRNDLLNMAQWEYVSFIDDDDMVSDDYVDWILWVIYTDNPDVICYWMMCWDKFVDIWIDNPHCESETCYNRQPNDKMCRKKTIARAVLYENIQYEDTVYAERASKLAESEHYINKVLYYYRPNGDTSECKGEYRKRK